MAQLLIDLVRARCPGAVLSTHAQFGDETLVVDASRWLEVARLLRDDPAADMAMLVDLTAVDFPEDEPRFEVVMHLMSLRKGHRLRVKARVGSASADVPELDSLTELWASANWAERECYDMFGIRFRGHPDLRRILLYPEFEGYPLRKDYPAQKTQPLVPYRDVPNTEKLPPFGPHEGMPFGRRAHDFGPNDLNQDG